MMILLNRKRTAYPALFAGVFLFALTAFYALHPNLKEWVADGLVLQKVNTSEKVIALTFDDGPNPPATRAILKVLEQNDAKATFFVNGVHAVKYQDMLRETAGRGHEIGNHGYTHLIRKYNDPKYAREDIQKNQELIEQITGVRPALLRPPGGFLSRDLVEYTRKNNLLIVTWYWKADYKDWAARDPRRLAQSLELGAQPGEIVVLHDGGPRRSVLIKALEISLPRLREQGYRFVTVSDLRKYARQPGQTTPAKK
ncbi:MAG: polysaccharide deacetylase family protein [Solirubrobacterales bacterium]